jgi:predicted nucleic acid-binding protein
MSAYIFDSYALLTLFRKEPGYEDVMEWLSKVNNPTPGFMPVINLGEVYYMTCRKQSTQRAELALHAAMQFPIQYVNADLKLTLEAAHLKSRYKISYADAFAAALTIQKKGTLITGDPEFKSLTKEKDFKVHFINR